MENSSKNKVVAVTVAMDSELELLGSLMSSPAKTVKNGFEFTNGVLADSDKIVVVCKSGIGKVNAALTCAELIWNFSPDIIISSGVCGAITRNVSSESTVKQGDIIIADTVRYHDVWCGSPNKLGQVQGMPAEFVLDGYKSAEYLAAEAEFSNEFGDTKFLVLPMLSGDWFLTEKDKAASIMPDDFTQAGVDMETGALAQTCYQYGKKFASVRIVSDVLDISSLEKTDNDAEYSDFWTNAPKVLKKVVTHIIKNC